MLGRCASPHRPSRSRYAYREEDSPMTDRFLRRAVTRRELLRHGGRVAASLPVLALAASTSRFGFAMHALAAPPGPTPAPTRAGEWVAPGGLRAFATSGWDSFVADFPFGALGA